MVLSRTWMRLTRAEDIAVVNRVRGLESGIDASKTLVRCKYLVEKHEECQRQFTATDTEKMITV